MFKYCGMLFPHTFRNILRNAYGCMIFFQHNKIITCKLKKKNMAKLKYFLFCLPANLCWRLLDSSSNAGFHKSYTILTYDYMKMNKIMKSSTNIIIECYFDVHIFIRQIHVNCVCNIF